MSDETVVCPTCGGSGENPDFPFVRRKCENSLCVNGHISAPSPAPALRDHDAEILAELRAACDKAHIVEPVPVAAGTLRVLLDTFAATREHEQAALAWRAVHALLARENPEKRWLHVSTPSAAYDGFDVIMGKDILASDRSPESAVLAAADAACPGWRES